MDSETTFVLVRTNKSCGGGDDDYDVCDGEKSLVGSCATHKRRRKRLGSGRSLPKAASDHCPIAGMPLAASKQWRNFGRNGPATTLFAIASPTFQTH
jgi:hypothetical protein